MPYCEYHNDMRATYYCMNNPKCNNDQGNYCFDCFDDHQHVPVCTSKKVAELCNGWTELLEQIPKLISVAEASYSTWEGFILFCDKVNSELPQSERIKQGEMNIKLDYEELT